MSIEFLAEIIELRRLRENIVEMSLRVEKPVKEIGSEEVVEEAEELIPRSIRRMMKKTFERMSEYSPPDLIMRLTMEQYSLLGRPVIGDKLKIKIEADLKTES